MKSPTIRIALALLVASTLVTCTTAAILTGGVVDFFVSPIGGIMALCAGILLFVNRHTVTGARWWLNRVAILSSAALFGLALWNMNTAAANAKTRYASDHPRTERVDGQP